MKRKCSKGKEIKAEVNFFQIRKCSAIYSNEIQCWCEGNWFGWLPFPPSCWAAQRAVGEGATSNSGRWGIELIKKRYIKLGILWTCLPTWLMLMSQVTDVALRIWYKFPVVLPGDAPPRPVLMQARASLNWNTDAETKPSLAGLILVAVWMLPRGQERGWEWVTTAGGRKDPLYQQWQRFMPDYSACLLTNWQDMNAHAHKRPLVHNNVAVLVYLTETKLKWEGEA